MNYWVFSTTSDSFEIVKTKNIWAVGDGKGGKKSVNEVKPDDLVIFYVIKTGSFKASIGQPVLGIVAMNLYGQKSKLKERR